METSEPEFYYLIRDPEGTVVGVIRSREKYGDSTHLGAYKIEPTICAVIETLEEFEAVDSFRFDESSDPK